MRLKTVTHQDGKLYGYRFDCPGCGGMHVIPTTGPNAWQFNGDLERPTFNPSILVYAVKHKDTGSVISPRCHSFVRDGKIEFLGDCEHALAGKTVDLPSV